MNVDSSFHGSLLVLEHLSTLSLLPWLLIGDFNDMWSANEKWGCYPHSQWLCNDFNEVMDRSDSRDLKFDSDWVTWKRGKGSVNLVWDKLDWILISYSWVDLFGEAKATSFGAPWTDHLLLAVWLYPSWRTKTIKKFKFENIWLFESQCRKIVLKT